MKFSNIHPASESGFLLRNFSGGGSIVMQISFVMLIFLLFSIVFKTNSCTVCHIITMNMLKTSKRGLIS